MKAQERIPPEPILVTGGAGFIGGHLVRRLVAEGRRVRVLDNFSTGRADNLAGLDGVEVVEGDVRRSSEVAAAMRGVRTVFHLAALPSVSRSWQDPVVSLATNAHGTANVVEAAAAQGVSLLVYSSSSSVYGDQDAAVKTESLDPKPISPYGYSKFLGEKIALAHAAHSRRMRVLALRYFNVFGPRQDPDSPYSAAIPIFIKHAIAGTVATIFGDGLQSRDFTYVENVVDANVMALDSSASGMALNVACGQSHSLLELAEAIGAVAGRPLQSTFGPERQGDIRHSLADITLAKRHLGYCPRVGFLDGLRRTFDAYRPA